MAPRFPVVAIEASEELVDELCALLFELGACGVEQRDGETHPAGLPRLPLDDDAGGPVPQMQVAYADVETSAGELRSLEGRAAASPARASSRERRVTLLACFDAQAAAEAAVVQLAQTASEADCRLVELRGDDWLDRHRQALAPFSLTPSVTIVPPWLASSARDYQGLVLVMDPGRAFGTGLHATTRLVAGVLADHADSLQNATLLDVGVGSGVLSLTALLLGVSSVVGIDNDPQAVAAAQANADRNGLAERAQFSTAAVDDLTGQFDWVVANIEARVLRELAAPVEARVRPGGTLVLSGVLEPQLDELLGSYGVRADSSGSPFELVSTRRHVVDPDCWMVVVLRHCESGL